MVVISDYYSDLLLRGKTGSIPLMPSLTRDTRPGKGKYWICCYTASDGRQLKRSTKRTNKREAEIVCHAWAEVEDLARGNDLTEKQVRRVIQTTLERLTGKRAYDPTVREWMENWLNLEKGTIEGASLKKYEQVAREFLTSLGPRAGMRLEAITVEDILALRDSMIEGGRSPKTVNGLVRKVLNRPFRIARDQGIITTNPVAAVKSLRDVSNVKGTFTPEQIQKLIAEAVEDWKGLILAGYYTGARLKDLATLQWANVNLDKRFILFRQSKTKRYASKSAVQIPIHPELEEYFLNLIGPNLGPKGPVFPELHDKPGSGKSGMSMAFKRIMSRAGIDDGSRPSERGGKGRATSLLSFHSLRHSFNSALANAGVSQELRQKLTGHASAEMNALYTHHELETIRGAIETIQRLPS
jgi:integrase